MENFISPDEKIPKIVIAFESALKGKPIQMVSIRDIGAKPTFFLSLCKRLILGRLFVSRFFAARALEDTKSYEGRIIPLAGEELTMAQVAEVYGVKNWKVPVFKVPEDHQIMLNVRHEFQLKR